MGNRILVCGANGAGKTTLGWALAEALHVPFMDIEGYFFPQTEEKDRYAVSRTQEEAVKRLLQDMNKHDDFVLAAVKVDYGQGLVDLLSCAVHVIVPKAVRMKRVRDRSLKMFGDRVRAGGDLYEREKRFFDLVDQRPENLVHTWLATTGIPIIEVDGQRAVAHNREIIRQALCDMQRWS